MCNAKLCQKLAVSSLRSGRNTALGYTTDSFITNYAKVIFMKGLTCLTRGLILSVSIQLNIKIVIIITLFTVKDDPERTIVCSLIE